MSTSYDDDDAAIDADIAAAHAVKLAEIAGTSASPNAKYRHRIDDAARIIALRTGVRFSADSLRKSDIPRIYVGRNSLYADEDLHAYADELLDRAVLHQGPRSLKRRKQTEGVGGMASHAELTPK